MTIAVQSRVVVAVLSRFWSSSGSTNGSPGSKTPKIISPHIQRLKFFYLLKNICRLSERVGDLGKRGMENLALAGPPLKPVSVSLDEVLSLQCVDHIAQLEVSRFAQCALSSTVHDADYKLLTMNY
ncbi:hypothetical protein WISP_67708 [Willisornis vidua]|uniref:Uncharacterized protein n=1 Tax=Willisornis vidua TaxID=1566151 RepID=A0ABQ9DBB1_9PASS|nr:hypothetical protein WISP_67708 [Willisornis vidua]